MQVQLMLALTAGFLAAPVPKADTTKDAQTIQGTWIVASAEREGKAFDDIKGEKLAFKDGSVVITTKNKEEKGVYKIDATKEAQDHRPHRGGQDGCLSWHLHPQGRTLKIRFSESPATGRPRSAARGGPHANRAKRQKKSGCGGRGRRPSRRRSKQSAGPLPGRYEGSG